MARRESRPPAQREVCLTPLREQYVSCGKRMWVAYHAQLSAPVELRVMHLFGERGFKERISSPISSLFKLTLRGAASKILTLSH